MSYLTPSYPNTIKAFLETRPALAELADAIALYLLALTAIGLLILWRVKFYRPKPIRPKEPKPERSVFEVGLGFKIIVGAISLVGLLGGLIVLLVTLAVFIDIVYHLVTTPIEQWPWVECAVVWGLFLFSVFCLWLIGRYS